MKKVLLFNFIGILFVGMQDINAQGITPREGIIIHEKAPRNCLVVNLDPEPKTLKKAWKDYLKNEFNIKLKGIGFLANKDLLSAEAVIMKRIANDPLNFYTSIIEDENGSEMKVFAELKPGMYVNKSSNSFEFRALENILEDFLAAYLPKYYQGRVKDAEKRLLELAEEREDLKKKILEDSQTIDELEGQIEQRKLELESNQSRLEVAESKLQARKEKLERIKKQLN